MRLADVSVLFLDLQTTGATPEKGHILEIAYASTKNEIENFFIALPDGCELPRRIQMVTGITEKDLTGAHELQVVLDKIKELNQKICIIHFAQFETPFLNSAFNDDLPFKIICTHEITKRLYPNLPSRGIKALAGFFGINTGDFKRASAHVYATKLIWQKCIEALSNLNVHTEEDLEQWLQSTPKVGRKKLEYPLPKEKRLHLPDVPGIYKMKNAKGEVLYVGKATSLFDRVNSYFRGQKKRDARKLEMLAQVYDIEVVPCVSPLAAALLETDEIKRLDPYYNIALKVKNRSVLFFERDFSSFSSVPDHKHTIGPYASIKSFESVFYLCSFLGQIEEPLPPVEMFYEQFDPALILEGINELLKRHGLKKEQLSSMRTILAQGLLWSRRQNKSEDEIDDDSEEIESSSETEVTADDIADKLERHFVRAALHYRRAKELMGLFYAKITYCEKEGTPQVLTWENNNSWETDPILTYDRLMVLSTELNRITTQGGQWHIINDL